MTIDCPTCGQPATLRVTPLNDRRLAKAAEVFVCPNGHTVNAQEPDDGRLTR